MAGRFKYRRPTREDYDERTKRLARGGMERFTLGEFEHYEVRQGNNHIRILPATWDSPSNFWGLYVHVHYRVGANNASVLCLAKMGKGKCPLCEERALAERRGDDDTAKALRTREGVLAWIIDRKDESKGPLLWVMPKEKVATEIVKREVDRHSGELLYIDDPREGYDFYFDVKDPGGEKMQRQYTGIERSSHTSSVKDAWIDFIEASPLPDTLLWRNYDEVKEIFDGVSASNGEDRSAHSRREPERDDDRRETRGRDRDRDDDRQQDRGGGRGSRSRDADDEPGDARHGNREYDDRDPPPRRSRSDDRDGDRDRDAEPEFKRRPRRDELDEREARREEPEREREPEPEFKRRDTGRSRRDEPDERETRDRRGDDRDERPSGDRMSRLRERWNSGSAGDRR